MATLNFLIPTLSWVFILTDNTMALNECLGKGYLNFLSTESHYCKNDDILCWVWLSLLLIIMANIIDGYCVYQCIKDIKQSTEKSRNMLTKQAYTNRKRYVWSMVIVIAKNVFGYVKKSYQLNFALSNLGLIWNCIFTQSEFHSTGDSRSLKSY